MRGRLLDQVVDEQLPAALDLAPDLVSFHAGPNDVLRPRTVVAGRVARYDSAVARLEGAGVQTLLFTVIERAGGTGRTAARLAERFRQFNSGVRRAAARHGCAGGRRRGRARPAGPPAVARGPAAPGARGALPGSRPRCWRRSVSTTPRCSAATRLVARAAAARGAATGRRADVLADVRWVRRYFAPWVGRRLRGVSSGDGLDPKHPQLVDVVPAAAGGSAQP